MKPAAFAYFQPKSRDEALALLGKHGADGKILAGGQSLVPAMNFRLATPDPLIDINAIDDLDYLRVADDGLHIGALTRHAGFHRPVMDGPLGALLSNVVAHIAHYPIRQRGTFAGSIAHADPASEWCLVATVLDANMTIASAKGARTVAQADFFKGMLTTDVQPDELLVEVLLPPLSPAARFGFQEFSRRAGDFGLAMALAVLEIDDDRIRSARLGIGGVADRAIRLSEQEAQLVGQQPSKALFEDVGASSSKALTPNSDIHASVEYRRDLIRAMVKRALLQAAS